jgi:hypothetical protein
MCLGGNNSAANDASNLAAQQQAGVAQGTQAVNQAFSGFTPQFYQGRTQAYINAAEPQLQNQYQNTLQNLTYRLGNQGLTNSSAGNYLGNQLNQYTNQQQQNIGNQAYAATQGLEQQVANSQNQILGQLSASYNPTIASQQALNAAANFATPSPAPAIGNLFQDWTNIYGTQQQSSIAAQYPYYYGQSAYGPSAGSSQSVIY